jgi:hypothetical protein
VDDPVIPFAMGKAVAGQLGGRATFIPMEGAGHYPHLRDLSDPVAAWARSQNLTSTLSPTAIAPGHWNSPSARP